MKKLILILLIFVLVVANVWVMYSYQLKCVSENSSNKEIIVDNGETLISIAPKLKENNLIRSILAYKIYIKLNNINSIQAGKYILNETMGVSEILEVLGEGSNYNPDVVSVTIPEGKRLEDVASIVAEATNHTKEELLSAWNDETFLDEVINKYWFVTEEIKNEDIIYPLEGYFFPSTYELQNKDVSASYIAYRFLDQMDAILTKYKDKIDSNEMTVHEILTLASIVEHEAILDEDRPVIAGVFYNRLKDGWKLESCATVGYAIGEWKLTYNATDLATNSKYNTYYYAGLPIGPGNMPSEKSIEATLNPTANEYYFFMANVCDVENQKTYFAKTYLEHDANVKKYLTCF